ncbi:tRNA (adenosine(37)-N6)-dimethylallyltransferase MiaA [Paeniglutamicibacter cryotolerans]|uniref:tRNA dimethylallyltransferase n=1 Tax=Paeniglutamicibacter cryotolerans TaxID=670079 RepID=A0A839QIF6_9MICC|nr:tRNA (adenosine(37)-N6)-dimethylallyltransferase MiaA [Paeniglutamicibacter cryotolerans]MBB2996188.1 tRNA dimethylallyltransferase [Paeniglutamicibacter cryotolerans]
METIPLIAVVGPTGTGKSDLSIALARELGGEIVNADALQFYRGMDIGTAKLPPAERGGIEHHLLDIMDVREEASVADFQLRARETFELIRAKGSVPILVGGSGLYVRAALDALHFPPTDPVVRASLEARAAAEGIGPLLNRLREVDPASAERNLDDRRVVRALEVYEISGRPFSAYMPQRDYVQHTVQLGLDLERKQLHGRLEARVHGMVAKGLADEVRELAGRGLREGKTAGRAIGYSQFLGLIDGTLDEKTAVEQTVIATRQFARRQLTWFRADPRVHWLDAASDGLVARALAVVREQASARG